VGVEGERGRGGGGGGLKGCSLHTERVELCIQRK